MENAKWESICLRVSYSQVCFQTKRAQLFLFRRLRFRLKPKVLRATVHMHDLYLAFPLLGSLTDLLFLRAKTCTHQRKLSVLNIQHCYIVLFCTFDQNRSHFADHCHQVPGSFAVCMKKLVVLFWYTARWYCDEPSLDWNLTKRFSWIKIKHSFILIFIIFPIWGQPFTAWMIKRYSSYIFSVPSSY